MTENRIPQRKDNRARSLADRRTDVPLELSDSKLLARRPGKPLTNDEVDAGFYETSEGDDPVPLQLKRTTGTRH
jgi:hypothetical protein